jgi:hypothetical protein
MKKIQPIHTLVNNQLTQLTNISLVSVMDNLSDSVTFEFTLSDNANLITQVGRYAVTAPNYQLWDSTSDGAYVLVTKGLGLTLV